MIVATALPAAILATLLRSTNRSSVRGTLRQWKAGVPTLALVVTAPLWLIVVLRGLLYPAIASDHLENSWGGPTLVGAWVVHLMIGVGMLLAASFLLAMWRTPVGGMRDRGG